MVSLKAKLLVSIVFFVAVVDAGLLNDTREVNAIHLKVNEDDSAVSDVGTSRIKHHYLPFYGGTALRKSYIKG